MEATLRHLRWALFVVGLLVLSAPAASPQPDSFGDRVRPHLPAPVLPAHPEWVDLYWKCWEVAWAGIEHGTEASGLSPTYFAAGPAGSIAQGDACFAVLFTRYGRDLFPLEQSLDSFYRKQHADGFICAQINTETGEDSYPPESDGAVGPPLLAWAEWQLYQLTADRARVRRVLPVLERHYRWLKAHRRRESELYYAASLASGMAGLPRSPASEASWARPSPDAPWESMDFSAQQALNAQCLAQLARAAGNERLWRAYDAEYAELSALINLLCWDRADGMYYDRDRAGESVRVKTVASFWPLVAGLADPFYSAKLLAHLVNEDEFWRPHLVPSVSADQAASDPLGRSLAAQRGAQGRVWPAADYAIIKGLDTVREWRLAAAVAENHIGNMSAVLQTTGALWSSYAPDEAAPATGAEPCPAAAWVCSPLPLTIENVLGIEVSAPDNTVTWHLRLKGEHGLRDLRFGPNRASLHCSAVEDGRRVLTLQAAAPFTLIVIRHESTEKLRVPAGGTQIALPSQNEEL